MTSLKMKTLSPLLFQSLGDRSLPCLPPVDAGGAEGEVVVEAAAVGARQYLWPRMNLQTPTTRRHRTTTP